MAAVYQMNDYDFVVKREKGVLEHEAFISPALYHRMYLLCAIEWQLRETMFLLLGALFSMLITKGTLMLQSPKGFLLLPL